MPTASTSTLIVRLKQWSQSYLHANLGTVNTFLVRFGGISGSFGLAMGIFARLSLAKIRSMARPNSPDMPPKRTKKVRLSINNLQLDNVTGADFENSLHAFR